MPVIKLPEADWGEAWRLLIQEGGTTRISKDHVYIVSGRQIELLQDKQLPFEVLDEISPLVHDFTSSFNKPMTPQNEPMNYSKVQNSLDTLYRRG